MATMAFSVYLMNILFPQLAGADSKEFHNAKMSLFLPESVTQLKERVTLLTHF
jgi:hypothetical protein